MNVKEYQDNAARTLVTHPDFPEDTQSKLLIWGIIGLTGEAGEVAELIKKGIFHQHGLDREALQKELGDVLWYVASICTAAGMDMSEVMSENIAKLKLRYPNGFNPDDSKKRVDVK